uniref:Uncharacterized protein n=1 Tax=Mucochytrium quahogii TaxID=96639 RepID=A0A7S2SPS8_9STRA|mmetsp:Transcript_19932/g.32827  ORF Transcript_19932/g.32827 Transcript_19932/m.32827 type:complete len:322 (+) Transcript_19932:122-1087(+)
MIPKRKLANVANGNLCQRLLGNAHVGGRGFVSFANDRSPGRKNYRLWVASSEDMDQSRYSQDVDDEHVIRPWGFVSQPRVAKIVGPRHSLSEHTLVRTTPHLNETDRNFSEKTLGTEEELCQGALHAYLYLMDNFKANANPSTDQVPEDDSIPEVEELMSPGLYDLYCQQLRAYHVKGLVPRLEYNRETVSVTLLNTWFELQGADTYDSIWGFKTEDLTKFVKMNLFDTGDRNLPFRGVAAFCIESLESFNVEGGKVEHSVEEPMSLAKHYWVMETTCRYEYNSDLGEPEFDPPNFTIRNINDAVEAKEHEKCSPTQIIQG